MRKVRSFDTTPEILIRKELWKRGLRFRLYSKKLPGKPDIVMPSRKVAIFIDGDFWHGGQWQKRRLKKLEEQFAKTASRNYWVNKIKRTMNRDCILTSKLLSEGWTVLRIWESDLYKDLEGCISMIDKVAQGERGSTRLSLLPEKTFAEFFSGIGLMRMGLERQGWNIKFANDIDPQKCKMYSDQFPDWEKHLVCDDIHVLSASDIPSVTLATASFPCNDLSLAGARKGLHGKQSSAYWGFIRILKLMKERRPPLVLLENVVGFLTSHKGNDLKAALVALNELGYSVDVFILDAACFVPQSRQRLFVVGVHDEIKATKVKSQMSFFQSDVRPKALADFIFKHDDINWNIRDLPNPQSSPLELKDIIEELPEDNPIWWSEERAKYLLNQMSPRHRHMAQEMIKLKVFSYGTVFRRVRNGTSMAELRTDGVAGCLRTPRGGSGRQILFRAGKGSYAVRLMTPRECSKLMGADDFQIKVPLNQALFGFGDAVCVPVIEWIAENYLNPVINELMRGGPMHILDGE